MSKRAVRNLLTLDEPLRSDIEALVRSALDSVDEASGWEITLRNGVGPSTVSIERKRASGAIAFASIRLSDDVQDIACVLQLLAGP